MILCATNLSFLKLDFLKFLKNIKDLGFKNVELAPTLIFKHPFTKKNQIKIKRIVKKNKIKIQSIQSVFFNCKKLYFLNDNDKEYLINYFIKVVKFARFLSIRKISIGSCPSRQCKLNKKALWHLNLFLFKKFSQIAKSSKIIICIEPVSKKYGNNFLFDPYEASKFVKKINKPNIKLLLDTGNLKSNKIDIKNFFKANKKFIHHVQISEKELTNLNINSIRKSVKLFQQLNYKKTTSIEYLSSNGRALKQLFKMKKFYIN